MKIAILAEGDTEKVFVPFVQRFLEQRGLAGKMPKLLPHIYDGRIPTGEKLKRAVALLTTGGDAADAKRKMIGWAANDRFHAHVALHDFEAWLLPFWDDIKKLAKHNRSAPAGAPETVNHSKPPSKHLKEIFEAGKCRDSYVKARDAKRILEGKDLAIAAAACPELKSFLNTLLKLAGGALLP